MLPTMMRNARDLWKLLSLEIGSSCKVRLHDQSAFQCKCLAGCQPDEESSTNQMLIADPPDHQFTDPLGIRPQELLVSYRRLLRHPSTIRMRSPPNPKYFL